MALSMNDSTMTRESRISMMHLLQLHKNTLICLLEMNTEINEN